MKSIIYIITIFCLLFYGSQNIFCSSFGDFITETNQDGSSSISNDEFINFLGNDEATNEASFGADLGDIQDTQLGIKTDCTQISTNFEISAYIEQLIERVKAYAESAGQIIAVNTILQTIAYPFALERCLTRLGMTTSQAPVLSDIAARIKETTLGTSGEAISVGTNKAGGNPSYGGAHVDIKPKEIAQTAAQVNAAIAKYDDKVFRNCMTKEINSIVAFIDKLLNWKATLDVKEMFNLRQECILNKEQTEYDVVKAIQEKLDSSPKGKLCLFDGTCISTTGKITKESSSFNKPTKTEFQKALDRGIYSWRKITLNNEKMDPITMTFVNNYFTDLSKKVDNDNVSDFYRKIGNTINIEMDMVYSCIRNNFVKLNTSFPKVEDKRNAIYPCFKDVTGITVTKDQIINNFKVYLEHNYTTATYVDFEEAAKNAEIRYLNLLYDKFRDSRDIENMQMFKNTIASLAYVYKTQMAYEQIIASNKTSKAGKKISKDNMILMDYDKMAIEKTNISNNMERTAKEKYIDWQLERFGVEF